jgi:hypothetical protein
MGPIGRCVVRVLPSRQPPSQPAHRSISDDLRSSPGRGRRTRDCLSCDRRPRSPVVGTGICVCCLRRRWDYPLLLRLDLPQPQSAAYRRGQQWRRHGCYPFDREPAGHAGARRNFGCHCFGCNRPCVFRNHSHRTSRKRRPPTSHLSVVRRRGIAVVGNQPVVYPVGLGGPVEPLIGVTVGLTAAATLYAVVLASGRAPITASTPPEARPGL